MRKLCFCSVLLSLLMFNAMAGDMRPAGGFYEMHTQNCDRASMQAALDHATAERRAVITVVKCTPNAAPDANASDTYIAPYAPYIAPDGNRDCAMYKVKPAARHINRHTYITETYSIERVYIL